MQRRLTAVSEFMNRLAGAAWADPSFYSGAEFGGTTCPAAFSAVVLSCVALSLGMRGRYGFAAVICGVPVFFSGWLVGAGLTVFIGLLLSPGRGTGPGYGVLFRALGLSSAPGLFAVFGVVPGITGVVCLVAYVWMLAAMVAALRGTLHWDGGTKAALACIAGWTVMVIQNYFLGLLF